jgi:hypothetical protein
MDKYRVTLDGQTYILEGDHQPSEEEARAAIGAQHQSQPTAQPAAASPSGPMAALRAIANTMSENFSKFKGETIDKPVQSLATIGGLAAAPITGGASLLPAMAASGLGAAGGAGLGSIVNAARGGSNGPQTAKGVAETMV